MDWSFDPFAATAVAVLCAVCTLAAIAGTVSGLCSRKRLWAEWRLARGLCPRCGYDLTGNLSGVCPECGTPVKPVSEGNA